MLDRGLNSLKNIIITIIKTRASGPVRGWMDPVIHAQMPAFAAAVASPDHVIPIFCYYHIVLYSNKGKIQTFLLLAQQLSGNSFQAAFLAQTEVDDTITSGLADLPNFRDIYIFPLVMHIAHHKIKYYYRRVLVYGSLDDQPIKKERNLLI
ncbi:hypothetical protein ACJX0J_017582, partial [Zea mays]